MPLSFPPSFFFAATVVATLLLPRHEVSATFTVAAVDLENQLMGAAGCTCDDGSFETITSAMYRPSVGHGVLVTQGYIDTATIDLAAQATGQMAQGVAPDQVLVGIANPTSDPGVVFEQDIHTLRQYSCVDMKGQSAGYTGENLDEVYASFGFEPSNQSDFQVEDEDGRFVYSVAGNIVTDATHSILRQAFAGLNDQVGVGCDLADRLFKSIDAVSLAGEGDIRCVGRPGTIAFVRVQDMEGNDIVNIDIPLDMTVENFDPYPALREQYNTFRAAKPCLTGNSTTPATMETPVPAPIPESAGIDPSTGSTDTESSAVSTALGVLPFAVLAQLLF